MPRFNIWVRKEDMELWSSVENKSDFISKALHTTHTKPNIHTTQPTHIIKNKHDAVRAVDSLKEPITYKQTQNWGA